MNEMVLLMRSAKARLSGKWFDAVIASLIYIVILGLSSFTSFLELIFTGPLTFGYILYISCLVDRGQSNLNLLFQGFSKFVDTFIAGLLVSFAVGIGMLLLIVPGIILGCGFALTFFIMVDEPSVSGLAAMKKSWYMMTGHKWEFFCLQLRFIGWILLSIITLGIGTLWLYPYMQVTNLNYYRKLRYGTY